jgi:eukaryotic-like serine/threonine-protein kinase
MQTGTNNSLGWGTPPFGSSQVIDGRFRLLHSVGSGSLAEVFAAEDLSEDPPRPVAVKKMHDHLLGDPTSIAELQREAELAWVLRHPNILNIYHVEVRKDIAYVVTELAQESLADLPKPVAPELVADFLRQIAAGVDYTHAQGYVHRDLKLENILITKDRRILLADFSLAMTVNGPSGGVGGMYTTMDAEAYGTPLYAAPEQWDDRISKVSDIYAIGVAVYYLLSGKPPYEGTTDELREKHKNAPVPSLYAANPRLDLPRGLDEVVKRSLEKNHYARYDSVTAFYNAFQHAIQKPIFNDPNAVGATLNYIPPQPVGFMNWLRQNAVQAVIGLVVLSVIVVPGLFNGITSNRRSYVTPTSAAYPYTYNTPTPRVTATPIAPPTPIAFSPAVTFSANGDSAVLKGHNGAISGLAWSDNFRLHSTANDISIVNWTLDYDGKQATTARTHQAGRITFMLLSHDRNTALVSTYPSGGGLSFGTYRPSSETFKKQASVTSFNSLAWSFDSTRVAISNGKIVTIWNYNVQTDTLSRSGFSFTALEYVNDLVWSPDGEKIAVTQEDGKVRVYNWRKPTEAPLTLSGHQTETSTIMWSPDGKWLATNGVESEIIVWDMVNGRSHKTFNLKVRGNSLAWSPDSKFLAIGETSGDVQVWSPADDSLKPLRGHTERIGALEWSPDSKWLASGSDDETVRIWKLQ